VQYRVYDGAAWGAPDDVIITGTDHDPGYLMDVCTLALDGNDRPCVAYRNKVSTEMRCAHLNGTWNDELVDSAVLLRFLVIAVNPLNDLPCLAYDKYESGDNMIPVSYAFSDGTTWHLDEVKSIFDYYGWISLEMKSDGQPVVAHGHGDSGTCEYAIFDGANWSHERFDYIEYSLRAVDIAIDSADRIHFSYYDDYNNYIKYTFVD